MKLHFYGSAASEGVPALFCECEHCEKLRKKGGKNLRTRTSAQIDEELLIDCSIDLYAQTLFRGLDMRKINTILVTHSHQDHFLPVSLTQIRPPMAYYSRPRKLDLYANKTTLSQLEQLPESDHKTPLEDYIRMHSVASFDEFVCGEYTVKALPASHDPREDCLLFILQKQDKTLLWGHDTGILREDVWQVLQNYRFDCVVLDCTMVEESGVFLNHMGLPDDIQVRQRMLREGMATQNTIFVATHFAHAFDPDHDRITPIFAENGFIAAYDGLTIEF